MKKFSGAAVPRHQVFMLVDGTYVVQWRDKAVQELLSGEYREYDHQRDFGHAITDYELRRLKEAGRVEYFNRAYVWLFPLPEAGRFGKRRLLGRGKRVRVYYLSTAYGVDKIDTLRSVIEKLDLNDHLVVCERDGTLILQPGLDRPFETIEAAEAAHDTLHERAPQVFANLAVAFMEVMPHERAATTDEAEGDDDLTSLDDLIASQTDTTSVKGKRIVLALRQEDEREAFGSLFEQMTLDVHHAKSAAQALEILEDYPSDLLILDIQMPDMHGWQLLGKLREIERLRTLPVMMLTDRSDLNSAVSGVTYVRRPISIARLRHRVWVTLVEASPVKQPSREDHPR